MLDEVHSVVFYSRPAGEIVLAPAHRRQWRSLMDRGVGFAAIHWGTGVGYGKLGDDRSVRAQYLADLGGWFRRPPGDVTVGRSRLHAPVEDHPVFRGWEPYEIRDEFYLRPQIHAQAQPLLRVDAAGGSHIVAWVMNRGGKPDHRSFGVTLGHFHDNFTDPRFRRLLVNGILWTAGYDVPEAGASVALGPQDTRLPEVGR